MPVTGSGAPLKAEPKKNSGNGPLISNKEVQQANKSACCTIF